MSEQQRHAPQQTPPGWYPSGPVMRWWDGQQWTPDTQRQMQPAPHMPAGRHPALRWLGVFLAGLLLLVIPTIWLVIGGPGYYGVYTLLICVGLVLAAVSALGGIIALVRGR